MKKEEIRDKDQEIKDKKQGTKRMYAREHLLALSAPRHAAVACQYIWRNLKKKKEQGKVIKGQELTFFLFLFLFMVQVL